MPTFDEILSDKTTYPDTQTITLAEGLTTTLGELRGRGMRLSDYTRKTQELAEQRRQLDAERQTNEAALAQARDDLVKLAERATTRPSDADLTDDQKIDQMLRSDPAARRLLAQIEAANARAESIEKSWAAAQEQAQQRQQAQIRDFHERTLARLAESDPTLDRDALTRYAYQNGIANLEVAWRDMKRDDLVSAATKKAADEAYERGKREAAASQPAFPLRRGLVPPAGDAADLGPFATVQEGFEKAASAAERDPEVQAILWGQSG